MKKPLVVYISGAPGSGKTTLGRLLSEQLYIPQISSDLIHGGIALSQPDHDRQQTLKKVFVPTIIDMAQKGVSVIVDHVLQKGISEVDIIDKLRPYATIISVHTVTKDPIGRYVDRVNSSNLPSVVQRRDHLLHLAAKHTENLEITNQPLDLGVPTIVINTDDSYSPSLDEIVSFIRKNYAKSS